MTLVVSIFGAAGTGKSTTAHGLTYMLKKKLFHMEYVSEHVKAMAWEGRVPSEYAMPTIFGAQWELESRLYGKVDVLVTDAPCYLTPFYERLIHGTDFTLHIAQDSMNKAQRNGVEYLSILLGPVTHYDARGRFQNQAESEDNGNVLKSWLIQNDVPFVEVASQDPDERVKIIFAEIERALAESQSAHAKSSASSAAST